MKKLKSIFCLFLCVVLMVSVCACSSADDYVSVTKENLLEVYNCLLEGDKEKLKGMLCEALQNEDDVDEQIDAFMEGIGGEIKSGDTDDCVIGSTSRSRDYGENFGEWTSLYAFAEMHNIVDNNNEEYSSLNIHYTYEDKNHPEKKGITRITLHQNSYTPTFKIGLNEN